LSQQPFGAFDPPAHDVPVRRSARALLECRRKVTSAEQGDRGQTFDADGLSKEILDLFEHELKARRRKTSTAKGSFGRVLAFVRQLDSPDRQL